jgi:hypothetical protein
MDQIAKASSWDATANRRTAGSSTASSYFLAQPAHCYPSNELSVDRAAKLHPLWQVVRRGTCRIRWSCLKS